MKLSQKTRILYLLSETEFLKAEVIALEIGVSSRTVQNLVKEINQESEKYGAEIVSRKGRGYLLHILNKAVYLNCFSSKDDSFPTIPLERINFMIWKLIQSEYVKLTELSESLFVSYATLTNDIKDVEVRLNSYNLNLERKPYYGIRIIGSEFDKRICLADTAKEGPLYDDLTFIESDRRKKKLEKILKQGLESNQFHVSAIAFNDLLIHLYITAGRLEKQKIIEEIEISDREQVEPRIWKIAELLFASLQQIVKVNLPVSEKDYLVILLRAKQTITGEKNGNLLFDSQTIQMANDMLADVYDAFGIDFRDDLDLKISLCQHLIPLQARIKWGISSKNPILNDIKKEFPLCNVMALYASKEIKRRCRQILSEDEIGYISLAFALALEKRKTQKTKSNICLVSAYGRMNSMLFEQQVKAEFSDYINEVHSLDVTQIDTFDFTHIDYIFSMVHIKQELPVPILQMTSLSIHEQIDFIRKIFKQKEQTDVLQYFDPDLFCFEKSTDKAEILKRMCDQMERKIGCIDLLSSVLRREEAGNTVFCNDVAMSHPEKAVSSTTHICVSVLENPVLWEEGKRVRVVFLICIAKSKNDNLTSMYRCLSKIVMNKTIIDRLVKNPEYSVLKEIIEEVKPMQ
ncbi:BglG family transcription antiterminator [Holdemania massiliensis]|uniref:BglG family transcription antiterminator n=1 Tax=Holdemania massiliensis TaxID=1468449 RepID=UPI001F05382C|nr:BglG family transcription antiterminator [Holdemania massiliensis]MCH1941957.1 BglG family transcription antiterminator [Holdemania massiliensis]